MPGAPAFLAARASPALVLLLEELPEREAKKQSTFRGRLSYTGSPWVGGAKAVERGLQDRL